MHTIVPLACLLSVIRPPGVQFENSLLQIAPVDKSKCPFVKNTNDIEFQLYTRHNPTVYQELIIDDDEKLFASNMDFNDRTVVYFHAFMEQPEDGSGIMIREAYVLRGDTNVIMVNARRLEAGPWYFTAAQNTWYIGRFAAQFIDYLVVRGLNLNNTHLIGHSLGAQSAGVAGSSLQTGRVARITGLDPALPLFDGLPEDQRLDHSDAEFVDVIHTDAGIFGYKIPIGHVDFYPNGGISPQPGCELEVVIPQQLLLNKCKRDTKQLDFISYTLQDTKLTKDEEKSDKESNDTKIDIRDKLTKDVNLVEAHDVDKRDTSDLMNNTIDNERKSNVENNTVSIRDLDNSFKSINKESNDNKIDKTNTKDPTKSINPKLLKIAFKLNQNIKSLSRKKRFLPFFRNENPNTFNLLNLLSKTQNNILPVVSVAREISTIVRNSGTELNHFARESNSYFGTNPSIFSKPLTSYVELNNGSKLKEFLKKFLGFGGQRIAVTSG